MPTLGEPVTAAGSLIFADIDMRSCQAQSGWRDAGSSGGGGGEGGVGGKEEDEGGEVG